MNRTNVNPAEVAQIIRSQGEVMLEFNLETMEAFGAWIIVENVLKKTTVETSAPIRTGHNLVHLVGPAYKAEVDIEPGDSVVFLGTGAGSLEGKGLNGGTLIAVPASSILTIDRSWRKPPKREKARHGALWFFRNLVEKLLPSDPDTKPPAPPAG